MSLFEFLDNGDGQITRPGAVQGLRRNHVSFMVMRTLWVEDADSIGFKVDIGLSFGFVICIVWNVGIGMQV